MARRRVTRGDDPRMGSVHIDVDLYQAPPDRPDDRMVGVTWDDGDYTWEHEFDLATVTLGAPLTEEEFDARVFMVGQLRERLDATPRWRWAKREKLRAAWADLAASLVDPDDVQTGGRA